MKTPSNLTTCLFFLFFLFYFKANSNVENKYFFKQFSLEEGLSQSFINSIYEDHKGFLWVGTRNGLNKYDTRNFKTYNQSKNDETSLPDDHINFIVEDSLFNLWVSTNRGLCIYNWENDSFTPIKLSDNSNNNNYIRVKSYLHVRNGIIFGGNSLYKFTYSTNKLERCIIKDPLGVLKGEIYYLDHWLGTYWILANRWNGVWLYDSETGIISPFNNVKSLSNSAFMIDKDKNLWYSSYAEGVRCVSPKGKLLYEYTTKNSDLTNDIILDIKENKEGIWLATDGGGICLLDKNRNKIRKIEYDGNKSNYLPLSSVRCLYFDKNDNLWAGTIRGGIFGIREIGIKNYSNVYLGDHNCLTEKTILTLYENPLGTIWIGTDGGGLNKFNMQDEKFSHYRNTLNKRVVSITDYDRENLLLSVFGEGLYIFNKKSTGLTKFRLSDSVFEKQIIKKGLSINVEKISAEKTLLLADSIYLFNPISNRIRTLKFDDTFAKSGLTANNPKLFYTDGAYSYLYSTYNLFRYDAGEDQVTTLLSLKNDSEINDICFDKNNKLFWLATTKGLFKYNPVLKTISQIETSLFNSINTLVLDKKNRIWIGAKGLLFCYHLETEKFSILGNSDGAPLNEYTAKACILTKDNSILKGGNSGLLYINKDYELISTKNMEISIMELLIDGLTAKDESLKGGVLEIPHDHSTLTLKIIAREADPFRKKVYRFNIIGSEMKPVDTFDNTLTLHALLPGEYQINVSCTQRDGGWSSPQPLIRLKVNMPWWKTRWFYLIVSTLFLLISYLVPYYLLRNKKKRLQEERKELERKNNEERVKFLINISHELRTPLTLIYTPLRRMLMENVCEDENKKKLSLIFRQVKYMKNMIDTLLDIRKSEVVKESVTFDLNDINECVLSLAEEFSEEQKERKIDLVVVSEPQLKWFYFDRNKINIVISNFLMNAFKYSLDNSKITLQVSLESGFVQVSVADEGLGFQDIDREKLFTRFYQGNKNIKGSGIGLALSKNIIEMHHGEIGCKENTGKGVTFYFKIPYDNYNRIPSVAHDTPIDLNGLYQLSSLHPQDSKTDLSNYTIMIVDDEPEILDLLGSLFMEKFGNILKASNGKEALCLLETNIPDIIVSDVMMPEMNGFELCASVKQNPEYNHIPVILLTAFNNMENTSNGYKNGADVYISKPFEDEVIFSIVINLLKNREMLRTRYSDRNIHISADVTLNNQSENFKMKLDDIINDHIDNPDLGVQFVADKMGFSKASLYSKMKMHIGTGLTDYISSIRIRMACDYLLQSDLTVQQISDKVGFNNQRYLSTVFKQMNGVTPTQYREINKIKIKEEL